jgi:hypothetical protein
VLEMSPGIRNWMVTMRRLQTSVKLDSGVLPVNAPLPPLQPYTRCPCGSCPECRSNAKWDRIFAKFEVKEHGDKRVFFRSPISDL